MSWKQQILPILPIDAHLGAIRKVNDLEASLKNPITLAKDYFDFIPNQGQEDFLVDIQNEGILGHLLQTLRGGGKTIVCAAACSWAVLYYPGFRAVILAGSEDQAKQFYEHFAWNIDSVPKLRNLVKGKVYETITRFKDRSRVQCVAASEFRLRSKHEDWLFIDEFVLVKQDIFDSAFPIVRTSTHPKRIFLTTASQTQAAVSLYLWTELWDHAREFGFRKYQWELDDCPWINKEDDKIAQKILDSETYKIEYLGLRGKKMGAVWDADLIDFAKQSASGYTYNPAGRKTIAGVDWGKSHETVVTILQTQGEDVVVCHVEGDSFSGITEWGNRIDDLFHEFDIAYIFADASHKFNNDYLKDQLDLPVKRTSFSGKKDTMIGVVRNLLEKKLLKIPSRFEETLKQMKAYAYNPKTEKPQKGNDDYVDSMLLACWGTKAGKEFKLFKTRPRGADKRFFGGRAGRGRLFGTRKR